MDYLITGATGFIGQQLVNNRLAAGHEVNYLGRRRSPTMDSRAAFHCWESGQAPPLDSVPTIDALIHLAGEPIAQRWNPDVKRRIRQSRVEGTHQLVTAMSKLRHKPSVLVSASAVGYYGDRGDEILTETSGPGNDFLAEACVEWEREAVRAREFGVRVVLVRISTVLGRDGGALPKMLTPFRLGLGGQFGNGRQWLPWIHIDDLVQMIIFAAENPALEGPVNGSAPKPVTNAEFTKTLASALHRPAILPVPRFALHLAMGEMAEVVFKSERVVPEAAERASFQFQYPGLREALRSLV